MTKTKEKATNIKAIHINYMFNKIAAKYDLLNNLMTFGYHHKWKDETVQLALKEISNAKNALDICTGTSDLAISLNKHSPNLNITCIDNSSKMLEIARVKINNIKNNISLILQDFENSNLPFKPQSFDLITIGFGLRNLLNKERSIEDIFKLLNYGGVFACIDLAYPENHLWQKLYFSYFFNIIPILGGIFAQNKGAYTYLTNSLTTWYKQEELKELILTKGFRKCYYKNILGGIVAIHIAVK